MLEIKRRKGSGFPALDDGFMKNDFTKKTRELFDFGGYSSDWEDGRNDADCIHHILGRVSSSPYNAAPLNNRRNHQPEGRKHLPAIHSFPVRSKYLNKTKRYLDSIWYTPDETDLAFLDINKKYYEDAKGEGDFFF